MKRMVWSGENAADACLDTLISLAQDSGRRRRRNDGHPSAEPASDEFVSALAAGMGAKLTVEVSPEASQSTGALAAAARQTGGRLVCVIPEEGRSLPRRSPAWTTRWSSRWATRISCRLSTSTSTSLWWAAGPTRTQACSSCSTSTRGVRWRSLTVCGEGRRGRQAKGWR
ncbi:unnamed protein product [Musa textilis]